ncbi:MAG: flagellar biosynthesis anti-sigma factor FlgM [Nitrospirae bacterium RIFCSPLOW2_12_42_9]|nr:MAG: flagellar biosynthesis anti-sigma factor FlgM [Nitrospirae bacterium GWA2_42_11]OGW56852.1 MAG: flagellar biosynthesis anti-sigma factor FlgM [Nitrospirae bacterium RIFCSPLOW2_12_42_9]OGW58762.1 MAG: flagellar biosynthesis anti-sigma factor FlgM [Nitrospirae bacterium RIFCSPHIGHO2_02_FULL_42_12]HAS16839.1 flagellar biosynthesis anti-sigma factor FlgM [Nitrospiraceae bacterium]
MNINGYSIIKNLEGHLSRGIGQTENTSVNKEKVKAGYTVNGDNVEISNRAIEFNRIRRFINEVPEIRETKVDEIKNDLKVGRYEIDTDLITSSLVREHVMDALLAPSHGVQQ